MKKPKVSFSIALLKSNRKYHAERIRGFKGADKKGLINRVDKGIAKYLDKQREDHQRFYDDLTLAINTLMKIKK